MKTAVLLLVAAFACLYLITVGGMAILTAGAR